MQGKKKPPCGGIFHRREQLFLHCSGCSIGGLLGSIASGLNGGSRSAFGSISSAGGSSSSTRGSIGSASRSGGSSASDTSSSVFGSLNHRSNHGSGRSHNGCRSNHRRFFFFATGSQSGSRNNSGQNE